MRALTIATALLLGVLLGQKGQEQFFPQDLRVILSLCSYVWFPSSEPGGEIVRTPCTPFEIQISPD